MTDFHDVWLRATYDMTFGANRRMETRTVADAFKVVVRDVPEADAPVVAILRKPARLDTLAADFAGLTLPYRLVEGRLMRPFARSDGSSGTEFSYGVPKWDFRHRDRTPTLPLSDEWGPEGGVRHRFNPGPFRPVPYAIPLSGELRKDGRRILVDGRSEAAGRAETAAGNLAMIGGVLHHVTRAPVWGMRDGGHSRDPWHAVVPDLDVAENVAMVDCRANPAIVADGLSRRFPMPPDGGRDRTGSIEVLDPTGIPDTARLDAVHSVARRVALALARFPTQAVRRDTLRKALDFFDMCDRGFVEQAERMVVELAALGRAGTAVPISPPTFAYVDAIVATECHVTAAANDLLADTRASWEVGEAEETAFLR